MLFMFDIDTRFRLKLDPFPFLGSRPDPEGPAPRDAFHRNTFRGLF